MTFTRDPETEGHVMVYMKFVISACMCSTAMIFLCSQVFRSMNSFYCHMRDHHVWPWNARSRHGLRGVLFLLVFVLRQWFSFVSSGFQVKEFILTIANCVIFTYDLHRGRANTSRNNKSHVDHDVTFSFKVTRESHAIGNSWNDFLYLITQETNKSSSL